MCLLSQGDPKLVSLHWLLWEVSQQMERSGRGASRFIVDIMPNLKFLINNDTFLVDLSRDMADFEQQVGPRPAFSSHHTWFLFKR